MQKSSSREPRTASAELEEVSRPLAEKLCLAGSNTDRAAKKLPVHFKPGQVVLVKYRLAWPSLIKSVHKGKVSYVILPLAPRPRTFVTFDLNRILPFDNKIPKNVSGALKDAYEAALDIINGTASKYVDGSDFSDAPRTLSQQERGKSYREILKRLKEDTVNVSAFLDPVPDDVEYYYDVVSSPICLAEVEQKIQENKYHNEHFFISDIRRMFSNCYLFNEPESPYYEMGYNLNKTFLELCKQYFPSATLVPQLPEQQPNVKRD